MQGSSARSIKAFHKSSKPFVWQSLQQSTCYSAIRFRFKSHVFRTNIGPRLSTTRQNCTFFLWKNATFGSCRTSPVRPAFKSDQNWSNGVAEALTPTASSFPQGLFSFPHSGLTFVLKSLVKGLKKVFKRLLKALFLSKVNVEMEPRKR